MGNIGLMATSSNYVALQLSRNSHIATLYIQRSSDSDGNELRREYDSFPSQRYKSAFGCAQSKDIFRALLITRPSSARGWNFVRSLNAVSNDGDLVGIGSRPAFRWNIREFIIEFLAVETPYRVVRVYVYLVVYRVASIANTSLISKNRVIFTPLRYI